MSALLQLLLALSLIIVLAKGAGILALRLKQPAILGEILAGLLLGPTLLDLPSWPLFAAHGDHGDIFGIITALAELGVILLMFIAGMETDLQSMRRVGKVALWAALGGVLAPVAGGIATGIGAGALINGQPFDLYHSAFIATILAATSVSITAQTLLELHHLRSKEGTTILGAAVIDDVIGIILVSVILAIHAGSSGGAHEATASLRHWIGGSLGLESGAMIALLAVGMGLYFAGGWAFGHRVIPRLLAWAEHLPTSQPLLAIVLVVIFLYAWAANWIGGVAEITGSYLAGLLIAQTHYKHLIEERIAGLTYAIFVPIFFINIGLSADATPLFAPLLALAQGQTPVWGAFTFTLIICAVAILTKVVGCLIGAQAAGFTRPEALRVGVGMISRGEVGLIIAGIGLSNGIITAEVFSVMVIMVLVTTVVTPPLLKMVFPASAVEVGDVVYPEFEDEFGIETVVGSPPEAHEDTYRHEHEPH